MPTKTSLDNSYYQVDNLLDADSLSVPNPNKNAYFGDLHIHTSNSFDAYTFGSLSDPGMAMPGSLNDPKVYASNEFEVCMCKSPKYAFLFGFGTDKESASNKLST